ncbi:hypothetical protein [Halalkalicoccus jeotgali]|uniref:hypothetical protein n=1 Tax=Halalkalicoccus jeotgali TaxID=413810 RepID=UPI0011D1D59B|nr:hypothetical protein [Halalkalicoccus jeotgali]
MFNLKRREYLYGCLSTLSVVCGCVSLTKYEGSVDIVLDNASEMRYQVSIEISDQNSGEIVFAETYSVKAERQITEAEIVEEGVYSVRATIEPDANSDVEFSTSRTEFELACSEDRYGDDAEATLVILLDPGYDISISKHCRKLG